MAMDENLKKTLISWITPAICLALAVATVWIVYRLHPEANGLERLTLVIAYIIVILVFFFGFMVLIAMATNKIDLSGLLCEGSENKASMSRFQLLIFTFVIAFSLVLLILSNGPQLKFPEVPSGILLLLGISASTYAVSKGIQAGKESDGGGDGDGAAAADAVTEAQKQAAAAQAAAAQAAVTQTAAAQVGAAQVAAAQAAATAAQGQADVATNAASQAQQHADNAKSAANAPQNPPAQDDQTS